MELMGTLGSKGLVESPMNLKLSGRKDFRL